MKKRFAFAFSLALIFSMTVSAQHTPPQVNTYSDEAGDEGRGFKKDHLFIGGSLNLGFSSYVFNVGGAPEVGYSFNKWLDGGMLININYTSERADPYYNNNTRTRVFNYGIGAFGRFYPLPFLFLQAEPEYNWTRYTQRYMGSPQQGYPSTHQQAASLLLGIGYGQRMVGQSSFYIALMFDALSNYGSPYRDLNNVAVPVLKAGFDFYLRPRRRM
ncbi:MAG: hypothetical protein JST47_07645 [Bacteroidetes bacterium]|nr:hypothetical protein [Bacteroidota bacterium]MBS1974264.1 hypothetical protein [Bacteroidota bacterium]